MSSVGSVEEDHTQLLWKACTVRKFQGLVLKTYDVSCNIRLTGEAVQKEGDDLALAWSGEGGCKEGGRSLREMLFKELLWFVYLLNCLFIPISYVCSLYVFVDIKEK